MQYLLCLMGKHPATSSHPKHIPRQTSTTATARGMSHCWISNNYVMVNQIKAVANLTSFPPLSLSLLNLCTQIEKNTANAYQTNNDSKYAVFNIIIFNAERRRTESSTIIIVTTHQQRLLRSSREFQRNPIRY